MKVEEQIPKPDQKYKLKRYERPAPLRTCRCADPWLDDDDICERCGRVVAAFHVFLGGETPDRPTDPRH